MKPTPQITRRDFLKTASAATLSALAAGYPAVYAYDRLEDLERELPSVLAGPGPTLVVLKVASLGRRPMGGGMRPMREAFAAIREHLMSS